MVICKLIDKNGILKLRRGDKSMQDNLARKLPERQPQRKPQKQVQYEEIRRRKANTAFCVKISLLCMIVFGFSMILMSRYAYINELEREILIASGKYESLSSENITREAQLKQSVDIDEVEQIATEKLGMVKPGKNQIVHINVPVKDSSALNKETKKGIHTVITEKINNLMAYLH